MSKGIRIRIHRAVLIDSEQSEGGYERILPDYPLAFEYEEFEKADGNEYERQKVDGVFENIIWGYGSELFDLLHAAAKRVAEKFKNDSTLAGKRDETYYRHRQRGGYTRVNSAATSQAGDTRVNSAATSQAGENSFREDNAAVRQSKRKRK
jgi:hypothetical protein